MRHACTNPFLLPRVFGRNPCRSPERSQKLEAIPKIGTPRQVEEELDDEEEDEDDSVMVPQVKVAEDGTLIIDEERLVGSYSFSK